VAHDALERSALAIAVVLDTLDQGTGAIAYAGNGYFNILSHRHGTLIEPQRICTKVALQQC
jgi:hypothetical protein